MPKPIKPDIIETSRLPAICPACASPALVQQETDRLWRVRCERCAWAAKYALVAKAAA